MYTDSGEVKPRYWSDLNRVQNTINKEQNRAWTQKMNLWFTVVNKANSQEATEPNKGKNFYSTFLQCAKLFPPNYLTYKIVIKSTGIDFIDILLLFLKLFFFCYKILTITLGWHNYYPHFTTKEMAVYMTSELKLKEHSMWRRLDLNPGQFHFTTHIFSLLLLYFP